MCRLYYHPRPTEVGRLEDNFAYLRQSFGGQGDGIASLPTGEVVKSVDADLHDLAEKAVNGWRGEGREATEKLPATPPKQIAPGQPIFFHTRLATVGGRVDALCQPFTVHPATVV